MASKIIEGEEARKLEPARKWELLSPFLRQHGSEGLAYATLQEGMEYFIGEHGYIAYTTVQHPVFARRPMKITFTDPVCARAQLRPLIQDFLAVNRRAMFGVISEACAEVLRDLGFKANCIGYEPILAVQTYNTKGNWKDLDLIKRARNEAKREGIVIREEAIQNVNRAELERVSGSWIGNKKLNDREIWIYARRPIFQPEPDVRKFVAFDKDGKVAGFVFYDPVYRNGAVVGYSANISRCDERRFGRLSTAVHMEAIEKFRAEGIESLNLCLAPFAKLSEGKYNDDFASKAFFQLSYKFGNDIYNFQGLAFHKSKYRGQEKFIYFASNGALPSNDIYLAFRSADITRSYFTLLGQLFRGMITAQKKTKPE